ncbi:MAG: peptidylprolyl isomerase [Planctomycetota bacterium]|nr:peptidylprolyl isomerase [Planctomycetota bacterium]
MTNFIHVRLSVLSTVILLMTIPVTGLFSQEDKPAKEPPIGVQTRDDEPPQSARAEAPARFKVIFELSTGDVEIEVSRKLAPLGVDQFYQAVNDGFYDDCRFFRVVKGFVVQFGINGDPKVQANWKESPIKDDPVVFSNLKGTICFATSGPDTRTTQLFINLADNSRLDKLGFAAFGRVNKGMKFIEAITDQYGQQPDQNEIQQKGNAYLTEKFPEMDYIKRAYVVDRENKAGTKK